MKNIRTDLAMEARDIYRKKNGEIKGIKSKKEIYNDILINYVEITNNEASKKLNKPVGKYITLESEKFKSLDPLFLKKTSYILAKMLKELIKDLKRENILIIGLGNHNITPDALGPKVISDIMVTRHIPKDLLDKNLKSVSAVSPGVMGITGIETKDIINAVSKEIKPSFIIVIDALSAFSIKRISTTIQITNTGITPGSGVGNKRKALNYDTLGIPVIAIGVPTVVDTLSISYDIAEKIFDALSKELKNKEKDILIDIIEKSKINDKDLGSRDFFVTPKEIDNVINHLSKVIANGINLSLHDDINLEYIENFIF